MSLLAKLEQRSLENPKTPISSEAVLEHFDIQPAVAGVNVTEKKALGLTAYWCGVSTISDTLADLPLQIFRKDGITRRPLQEHRVNYILDVRPNPLMSPYVLKELAAMHLMNWGNFYAEIELDGSGEPVNLWPLLPDRTGIIVKDRRKTYFTEIEGKQTFLPEYRVLHIPGKGFDGLIGYNVIRIHRESLGLSLAANEYGARFFGNSARPSGYLVHPNRKLQPDEVERIRQSWQGQYGGLSQAQRTAVLWEGMEFKAISISPEDAQFLETREFEIEEIARILKINPILLQSQTKATTWGTGVQQFLTAFAKFTIAPWATRIESAIDWSLFNEIERPNHYVKFNMNALLRGDPETQANILDKRIRMGTISQDEVRELYDENPLPDGMGKHYWFPLNMARMVDIMERPAEELPAPKRDIRGERSLTVRQRQRNAYKSVFLDGANRIVKRDIQNITRAIEKAFVEGKNPIIVLNEWIEEFYPKHRRVILQTMLPIVYAYAEIIAGEAADEVDTIVEELDTFANEYTETLATREINSSVGQLRGLMQETPAETLRDVLTTRMGEWGETRALKIAEREIVAVATGAARFIYQSANRDMIWRANPSACPLCQEMDGKRICPKDYFLMPGENVSSADRPGGLSAEFDIGGPPLHSGCQCSIEAA